MEPIRTINFDDYQEVLTLSNEDGADNRTNREQLKQIMRQIICNDLTKRQKQVCYLYYYQKQTIPQIAALLHVNKSTVSRTLARGLHNINQRIKYYKIR